MQHLLNERRVALRHAHGHPAVSGHGGGPHPGTVRRWAKPPGVRGVVLESFVLGGKRYTTEEAILRFVERLNG